MVSTEIAPVLYRTSVYVLKINLQFKHLLYATTSRRCFTRGCGVCFR